VFGLTTETFDRMLHPNVLYAGMLVRSDVRPGLRATTDGLLYSPFHQAWVRNVDFWLNAHFYLGAHLLNRAHLIYESVRGTRSERARSSLDSARVTEHMQPTLHEVSAAHRLAAARNIPFIVLLINPQGTEGFSAAQEFYNALVKDHCRREGIRFVDPLPELQRQAAGRLIYRTVHDQHWTPAAHAVAAAALLEAITRAAWAPRPGSASPAAH
jgi:hypothetical protein